MQKDLKERRKELFLQIVDSMRLVIEDFSFGEEEDFLRLIDELLNYRRIWGAIALLLYRKPEIEPYMLDEIETDLKYKIAMKYLDSEMLAKDLERIVDKIEKLEKKLDKLGLRLK
jgi:hypothetical protein